MKWVLHLIVMATATEKMGIMATGGVVYPVMATENKKILFRSNLPLPLQCERAFT